MRVTDLFIRHPVLAIVVNLAIVLVGWRALSTLPVQQYPQIESSSVLITTVYYGASAETVRGFLTTPIERVVSAISGVDHIESSSRAGVSTVNVRLKLNHNSTAALAEVTARLQEVRSELPAEAEPPVVEVQRADRPYASFYVSFTSDERDVPALTDWLLRTLQPQLATLPGVQRVSIEGGRQIAMRVWIDPDRLAALNLAPGDVQAALRRNNYLAAVGQTKSNLVQVNLLANTDLRSVDEFAQLIVADRGRRDRAPARRGEGGARRRGSQHGREGERARGRLPRDLAARRLERDRGRRAPARRDGPHPADAARRRAHAAGVGRHGLHARRAHGDHQDARRDDPDRGHRGVPVHGLAAHGARAARRDAGLADRRGDRDAGAGLQPEPAVDPRDRALGRARRRRRDRGGRERRAPRPHGQDADRCGDPRRARADRPDHRDDDHARHGLRADRLPGRPHRLAVPGVRDHARGRGGAVGHRRRYALAGDELALRAPARRGGPADGARQPRLRGGAPRLRADARRRARDPLGDRGRVARDHGRGLAALLVLAAGARARRGPEPREPVPRGVARRVARGGQPRLAAGRRTRSRPSPRRTSCGR